MRVVVLRPPAPYPPRRAGLATVLEDQRLMATALRYLGMLAAALISQPALAGSHRPSFVIFISDTTRADAVSAYGAPRGTTPTIDALAREGLLYRRATTHAPWTVPSHATLFTGLLPSQHSVDWPTPRVPDEVVMLAEVLRDAGYETCGVSENIWISNAFNFAQGFDVFVQSKRHLPVTRGLRTWWAQRDPAVPFFVFVNVIDPHWPYPPTEETPRGRQRARFFNGTWGHTCAPSRWRGRSRSPCCGSSTVQGSEPPMRS